MRRRELSEQVSPRHLLSSERCNAVRKLLDAGTTNFIGANSPALHQNHCVLDSFTKDPLIETVGHVFFQVILVEV